MNDDRRRFVVVPCSGIGKALGTVSREAAYELCENIRPNDTQLVALSKLVIGDEQACRQVRANPAVTIDGCKKMCAAILVKHNHGNVAREVAAFETFRGHKELKPEGIAELNPEGKQLARVVAEEIAREIDELQRPRAGHGGQDG
jgi:uncharacterized metal-binding protein